MFLRMVLVILCALQVTLTVPAAAGGLTTYYHNDNLGSPDAATNDFGELVWEEHYKPYGERIYNELAAEDNKIWYTGKEHEAETGLTYMNARYYDPAVGRFMAIDAVGVIPGRHESFNRYSYANNNPYKYVDPSGLYAEIPLEALSLTVGINSLINNVRAGDVGGAALDGAGLVADAVMTAFPGPPGVVGLGIQAARNVESAASAASKVFTNKTVNDGFFEVITEVPISGASRSAHRTSANKALSAELSTDTNFASDMNNLLGKDVLQHMLSGKSALKNPPGTHWHHPKDNPNVMQLLRKDVHQDKSLQNYLHEDGTGGFADHF
jgi:RHS repeat-associated protein